MANCGWERVKKEKKEVNIVQFIFSVKCKFQYRQKSSSLSSNVSGEGATHVDFRRDVECLLRQT